MPLFARFFRKKQPLSVEQQLALAASLLAEAETRALIGPKNAMEMLCRKSKAAYDVLCAGAPCKIWWTRPRRWG